jgi:hypothetical protein
MAKSVCLLYADPVGGHPSVYARDSAPKIEGYAGGQTAPTPKAIDFTPGEMLGDVTGTQEILECFFDGRPIRDEYLIVKGGKLAGVGAHSYSVS